MARRFSLALPLTKLRPPVAKGNQLARPRLEDALSALVDWRFALVTGPTGSGKTTLLSAAFQRLSERGVATAWLTLDRCERQPRYFLDHVAVALQQRFPAVGKDVLAMLQGDNVPGETVISALINDLAGIAGPLVLFLDDFQEAEAKDLLSMLDYLLQYLPDQVHVVIASERAFPITLAWARARGLTLELDWHDLKFTPAEVRRYLAEVRGLAVSDEVIADLTTHTEGWACAVQLAAIALQQQSSGLPRRTGPDFADALLEDVYARQSPEMQRFLLDTSILKRLSAPLCEALTGEANCREYLGELESAQFFVQRLDPEGVWLRYHDLFANFLKQRLRQQEPERVAVLMCRAGDWFAAHDQINEAMNYWLAGGAIDRAALLLAGHGQLLLRGAEIRELESWLNRLPATVVRSSPVLSNYVAWCALYNGRPLAVRAAVDDSQQALANNPDSVRTSIADEWILLRAMSAIVRYDWLDSTIVPRVLPEAFDDRFPVQRGFAYVVLGYARRSTGDLAGARASFMLAAELADAETMLAPAYLAHYGLASVDLLRARPDRALASLQSWFADPERRAYWRNSGAAFLRTLEAHALMEQDRQGEAAVSLDEAIQLLEHAGTHRSFYGVALALRARLRGLAGRTEEALNDVALAREIFLSSQIGGSAFRADLVETLIHLGNGHVSRAERLLAHIRQMLEESRQFGGEYLEAWQSLRCECLLASSRWAEAAELAQVTAASAREAGRQRMLIDCLLCQAIARARMSSDPMTAVRWLQEAQQLAEPGGIVLPFRLRENALKVLAEPAQSGSEGVLLAPGGLHQREAQILKLLDEGLRNKEIGSRLFLSEETVKWYLKRLYDTFDVDNRVQLLSKARKLGLLGPQAA